MFDMIITTSLLTLSVILIRCLFKGRISARLTYALWAVVLLKLLFPFSFFESSGSILNYLPEISEPPSFSETVGTNPIFHFPDGTAKESDNAISSIDETESLPADSKTSVSTHTEQNSLADTSSFPSQSPSSAPHLGTTSFSKIFQIVSLSGTLVMLLYFTAVTLSFRIKLCKHRQPLPFDSFDITGFAHRRIYFADQLVSPCLFGLFSPAVYLNKHALANKTSAQHILLHELCHLRHWDHIWSFFRCLCLALWWWNPLVWIAASLSKEDSELACDESTLLLLGDESRIAYGYTLIDLAVSAQKSSFALTSTSSPYAGKGKRKLSSRISAAAQKKHHSTLAVILTFCMLLLCSSCTFTGANTKGYFSITTTGCSLLEITEQNGEYFASILFDQYPSSTPKVIRVDSTACHEYLSTQSKEVIGVSLGLTLSRREFRTLPEEQKNMLEGSNIFYTLAYSDYFDPYLSIIDIFTGSTDSRFSGLYTSNVIYRSRFSPEYHLSDRYYTFGENSFIIKDRYTCATIAEYPFSPDSPSAKEITFDEWLDMHDGSLSFFIDTRQFNSVMEHKLSDGNRIYLVDDYIWFAEMQSDNKFRTLYSLNRLSPDEELLDLRISEEIIARNKTSPSHALDTESHTILKTARDGSTIKVYLIETYMAFAYDSSPSLLTSYSSPSVLTFQHTLDDYLLIDYWQPLDGEKYTSSIKEAFPNDIIKAALNSGDIIEKQQHICEYKANLFLGCKEAPAESVIQLLSYLAEGEGEFDKSSPEYTALLRMRPYTIAACVRAFSEGTENNRSAALMMSVCRDLLALDDLSGEFDTPQEWFDALIAHAISLSETLTPNEMAWLHPYLWEILEQYHEVIA